MDSTDNEKMLNKTLGGLSLSDEQIYKLSEHTKSIFTGEYDFCCSLEFFLNFNIGEVKS